MCFDDVQKVLMKTFELKKMALESLELQNKDSDAVHVHENCVTYVSEGLKTSRSHWNSLKHGSRKQEKVHVRELTITHARRCSTYIKHEEHLINVREIQINVRELKNCSGNIRETYVTYVRMA